MGHSIQKFAGQWATLSDSTLLVMVALLVEAVKTCGPELQTLSDCVARWRDQVPRWGNGCIDLELGELFVDPVRRRDMLALLDQTIGSVQKLGEDIPAERITPVVPKSELDVGASFPSQPVLRGLIELRRLLDEGPRSQNLRPIPSGTYACGTECVVVDGTRLRLDGVIVREGAHPRSRTHRILDRELEYAVREGGEIHLYPLSPQDRISGMGRYRWHWSDAAIVRTEWPTEQVSRFVRVA